MDDHKYLFKVVLVGNAGVGKTCLVRKFTQGVFPPGQSATIGVDFMIKTLNVNGDKIKLQIWDTAGQERFRSITQSYYRSAHAIVLAYDVSCQPTFDCINEWINEIEQYANKKALRILVGTKVDKEEEREVPTHIGESFAAANNFDYFVETSAASSENVEILFQEVATRLATEMRKDETRYGGNKSRNLNNENGINLVGRAQQQIRNAQSNCCGSLRRKRNAAEVAGSNVQNQMNEQQNEFNFSDQEQPGVDNYALKRLKNNAAVNKTRQKKRLEQENTSKRVKELREENAQLERSLDSMRRELALLKEMVVVCAAKGDSHQPVQKDLSNNKRTKGGR
uniref:Ras-related protein Rab-30 n=8 Tax=Meloidogyne TaxID=189290 RepID=A0A6V7WE02_MELEN|nr:unnamed protein product [Meloidogyne enterolobii]